MIPLNMISSKIGARIKEPMNMTILSKGLLMAVAGSKVAVKNLLIGTFKPIPKKQTQAIKSGSRLFTLKL